MKRLIAVCLMSSLLGATTADAAPGAAPLASSALVIQANNSGVQNLGGFHPIRNATVGAAVKAFGRPSSRRPRYGGSGCDVSWRRIGLKITFAYYGGGGTACKRGIAKTGVVQGAAAARWRTSRGVRIGDSLERLERRYPNAVEWEGDYWLAIGYSPVGDGGSYPVLAARVSGESVSGFEVLMSPAYD